MKFKNTLIYLVLSAIFLGLYFYMQIIMNIFSQTFSINFPTIGFLYIVMGFIIFTLFLSSYQQEQGARLIVVAVSVVVYLYLTKRPWQSMFIDPMLVMFLLSHLLGFIIPKDYFNN